MPEGLIEEIVRRIDVPSYYSRFVTWTQQGSGKKNWIAKCPFHSEKNGSFYVEVSTGRFKCFGCEESGDLIKFQEKIKNQTFNEALRELAGEVGIEVPGKKKKSDKKRKKNKPELSEETVAKLHDKLTPEAIDYLTGRGISRETINKYQIGLWKGYLVFPIRKGGKLHTYRFKHLQDKRIWQLGKEDLKGQDPIWVFPEPTEEEIILLCEGEIDVLNAISLGFNAITTTGGAGTWRDDFLKFFKDKIVHICYDIDEKGRISCKTVGRKIAKAAKEVRIIHLDLDIEKYPNGDLNDYFVKEEKTLDDFNKLIKDSEIVVSVEEDINVVEDDGCYWSVIQTSKDVKFIRISNFVIRLQCRYRKQDDTLIREIILVPKSPLTKKSSPFMLAADDMSSTRSFREFCFSAGDFVFSGKDKDLIDIWQLVMAQDPTSKEVFSAFKIGFAPRLGVWLFENMVIKNNEVFLPDENNICWNGNKGYSPEPIEVQSEERNIRIPNLIITEGPTNSLIKDFAVGLRENLGTPDALYGLGLVCGSIYFSDIINHFGCFPILWVYGKLQCGKNEYVGFLMRMFGLGRQDCESLPEITSTVPITRRLSYFGNIPVWFDEYRNRLSNVEMIKGVFRSAYNASGRSLGVKATRGVIKERINSPLIVSGEELPEEDEALLSRLIIVHLKLAYRQDSFYNEVFNLSQKASAHIYNLVKNKTAETTKSLIKSIEEARATITKNHPKANARIVLNHAITIGCYKELVDSDDAILYDYITGGMAIFGRRDSSEDGQGSNILLNDFIDRISVLISKGVYKNIGWYRIEGGKVYVWMRALYEEWAKQYRMITGSNAPSDKTILDHFKESNYLLESRKNFRIPEEGSSKNPIRSCLVFDVDKMPQNLKAWFGDSFDDDFLL